MKDETTFDEAKRSQSENKEQPLDNKEFISQFIGEDST